MSEATDSSRKGLLSKFEEERAQWTARIVELSEQLRDIQDVHVTAVHLHSERQRAVDYMHTLITTLARLNTALKKKWQQRFMHYTMDTSADFRLNSAERGRMVDADTAEDREKAEILEAHINFFRETLKGLDHLIWGVKHRIQLEELRRGNS